MTASYEKNASQALSNETRNLVEAFNKLDTDAKLAWFYYVYEKMGDSITPAAPAAAEPELAPLLLGNYFQLSDKEQLNNLRQMSIVLSDFVCCTKSERLLNLPQLLQIGTATQLKT